MSDHKDAPAPPQREAPAPQPSTADPHLDARLDEELDETFPASDPLPTSHSTQ